MTGLAGATIYKSFPVSISFDLPVRGGVDKKMSISTESQGITMSVERITTAPSMVRISLRLFGAFPVGSAGWLPTTDVELNGRDIPARNVSTSMGQLCTSAPGSLATLETSDGVDDPNGDWSVAATEMRGNVTDPRATWGHDSAISGDWTIHFTLP